MGKTTKPAWAYGDPSYVVEPSNQKKSFGWLAGEKPPRQYMNWIHFQTKAWIDYFESKVETVYPITIRSAASVTWSAGTLTFASPIDVSFRYVTGEQVNRFAAGNLALADGQVVVLKKNKTDPSPVTVAQGAYGTLGVGQYDIVAQGAMTANDEENEVVLFRRKGTNLEIPWLGVIIPDAVTFKFGEIFNNSEVAIDASQVVSGTFANARVAQGNVTQHQAALAIATAQVTSGTFADARVAQSNVTQHQAALSIAETQIPNGALLARVADNETITGTWAFSNPLLLASAAPVANKATRSQIPKAWALCEFPVGLGAGQPGTILASYNIASVVGVVEAGLTFTFTVAFSSAHYAVVGVGSDLAGVAGILKIANQAAGAIDIQVCNPNENPPDFIGNNARFWVAFFGDQ